MGLVSERKTAAQLFPSYTAEEKLLLAKKYTPEQMEAIEAGEKAIKPNDLKKKGVMRSDLGTIQYIEDFSRTRSLLDRPQKYNGPVDPNIRFMTPDEHSRARRNTWDEYGQEKKAWEALKPNGSKETDPKARPDDPFVPEDRLDLLKLGDREAWFVGSDGKPVPRQQTPMAFAPGLPKRFSDEEEAALEKGEDDVDPRDPDGIYNKLMKSTGLTLDQIFNYSVRILVSHRVVNQTRLGKIASQYVLAIAGNGDGRLGIGEAKGQEIEETMSNAKIAAIRSMQPIPRYENRTIFGEVEGKVSAVELKLMSRPPGRLFTFIH